MKRAVRNHFLFCLFLVLQATFCDKGEKENVNKAATEDKIRNQVVSKSNNDYLPYGGNYELLSVVHSKMVTASIDDLVTYFNNGQCKKVASAPGSSQTATTNAVQKINAPDSKPGNGKKDDNDHEGPGASQLLRNISGEPKISLSDILSLTDCPVPTLNTTESTITSNIEWQIFTYCVLNILPEKKGSAGYPEITKMQKHSSAYRFLHAARKMFMQKHYKSSLTLDEKFALFERIFLVTRFRKVTEGEMVIVKELIQTHDIDYVTKLYMVNWFISDFYTNHFNFQRNRSPAYVSNIVTGRIVDTNGDNINWANYRIVDENIYGFLISGNTGEGVITDIFFNTGNFKIQYYLPYFDKSAVEHNYRYHGEKGNDDKGGIYPATIQLLTMSANNAPLMSEINVHTSDESGVVLTLQPFNTINETTMWPNGELQANNLFSSVNIAPVPGGVLGECEKPEILPSGVVNGISWQKFSYCVLNYSYLDTLFGINYQPLFMERSALDYVFQTYSAFIESDHYIELSKEEVLSKIFQIITFREPTASERNLIKNTITNNGLNGSFRLLMEHWYVSSSYKVRYDYTGDATSEYKWRHFTGEIHNEVGEPLAGVKVTILGATQDVLEFANFDTPVYTNPVYSISAGEYSLPALLNAKDKSGAIFLKFELSGYSTRLLTIDLREWGLEFIQNIVLLQTGKATPTRATQVLAPDNSIAVKIPRNAVDGPTEFTVSNYSAVNLANLESTVLEFQILPSYQFNKPVTIEVVVDNKLLASFDNQTENLALFVKNGEDYKLLDNVYYDVENHILRGETDHFSVFAVGKCGIIQCAPDAVVDPVATVLDRQVVEYPSQLPQLKNEVRNLLDVGGWDLTEINLLTFPDTCTDTTCPPLEVNISQDAMNIPRSLKQDYVNIGGIQVLTAKVKGRAIIDAQAEQCGINPTASLPQLRVNNILSVDADMETTIRFDNVIITYPCLRWAYSCWANICVPTGYKLTCKDKSFDHYAYVTISGMRQAVYKEKNSNGTLSWYTGPTYSNGRVTVRISGESMTNQYRKMYADELQSYLQNRTFESYGLIKYSIVDFLNQASIKEPYFDQANCFESGAPSATITSFSNGDILGGPNAVFADGTQIPDATMMNWTSNREGTYKIFMNNDCSAFDTKPALYEGSTLKGGVIRTPLSFSQLTLNGPNSVKICIKDRWNSEIGGKAVLLYKTWEETACTVETVVAQEYICRDVTSQDCKRVKSGSKKTPGCWCSVLGTQKCCWCTSGCYTAQYKTQCSTVTRNECNWEDAIVDREVCAPQYRY